DGLVGQFGQNIEAVQAWHLNVEEAHVGRIGGECSDGLLGRGCGADHLDALRALQQAAQAREGQRLVIDEVSAQLHTRGRTISTTEWLSRRSTFSRAFSPNKALRRLTRLSRQCPAGTAGGAKPDPVSHISKAKVPLS